MYAWNNVRNIDHVWRHIASIWRHKYTSSMDIIGKITEIELNFSFKCQISYRREVLIKFFLP